MPCMLPRFSVGHSKRECEMGGSEVPERPHITSCIASRRGILRWRQETQPDRSWRGSTSASFAKYPVSGDIGRLSRICAGTTDPIGDSVEVGQKKEKKRSRLVARAVDRIRTFKCNMGQHRMFRKRSRELMEGLLCGQADQRISVGRNRNQM